MESTDLGKTSHKFKYLFVLVSFSYMLPWTVIGSLVHYFSITYGDNYFVFLNIAFYGVGLPVTLLQSKIDLYFDALYGSKSAFQIRYWLAIFTMMIAVLILPFCGFYGIITLTTIVGCCTWVAHGTTTTLTGIIKLKSNIMQQIGFALPAVYGIILSLSLQLSSEDIPFYKLLIFFFISSICVVPGALAWLYISKRSLVAFMLDNKDAHMGAMIIDSHQREVIGDDVHNPLLNAEESLSLSRHILRENPQALETINLFESQIKEISFHRWTLFTTIFFSILQGSFISYTTGCVLYGNELPSILFFTRILADLLGRPLALFSTPSSLKKIENLLLVSIVRGVFSLYFFSIIVNIYIYPYDFMESNLCHWLLIIFQVFFSLSSGYLNCLTYESTATVFRDEWQRSMASQFLTLTFQRACTSAVVVAILILLFVDVLKPMLGISIPTISTL